MSKRIGILRRIRLASMGIEVVDYRQEPGWRRIRPIYRARCPEHGLFEGATRGGGNLRCPHGWEGKIGCFFEVYVGEDPD